MITPETGGSRLSRSVATAALATAALSGLSACGHDAPPDVPRCFPEAQPAAELQDHGGSLLNLDVQDGKVTGDPMVVEREVEQKVEKATVQVSVPGAYGTGFLMENDEGDTELITATHVIGSHRLSDVTVIDYQGHRTHPVSGCYTYEKKGEQVAFKANSEAVDIDIAALKLQTVIGGSALRFATHPPKRGQWLFYTNYQYDAPNGYPRNYAGMVTEAHPTQTIALTGLQAWRNNGPYNYSFYPGGSGGPAVNANGEVEGMSYAGTRKGQHLTPTALLQEPFKVVFNGTPIGQQTGLLPTESLLTSEQQLKKTFQAAKVAVP
ncbi:MAG TPA: trypsin-like peptidase domain-containing protein [Candidatus Saccharimonadales bacterium]|nr:trypsin-like peptidase domain-containing protein [Candidatus Saccharimonadales bacterium]